MNKFKEMLLNGQKPLGTFVDTASTYVVECLGRTGFDYIIIDNEHSPVEAETTAELVRAAELAGLTPFARVRDIFPLWRMWKKSYPTASILSLATADFAQAEKTAGDTIWT